MFAHCLRTFAEASEALMVDEGIVLSDRADVRRGLHVIAPNMVRSASPRKVVRSGAAPLRLGRSPHNDDDEKLTSCLCTY